MANYLTSVDYNAPMVFITTYGLYNDGKQFFNNKSGFHINVSDLETFEDEIKSLVNSLSLLFI